MARRPLDNSGWGFASNCYVCEPKNTAGLRIPFFLDDEEGVVTADFQLGQAFSGAPELVHGGVTLAVLDEAMSWATIALAKTFAVTKTTTVTFHRPVRIDRPYRVAARVDDVEGLTITTSATVISNSTDKLCVEAWASFTALTDDRAEDVIGQQVSGDDAGYLKSRQS